VHEPAAQVAQEVGNLEKMEKHTGFTRQEPKFHQKTDGIDVT
jgi:hypothetical protein